ncbi:MAG: serine/threonine-protein kinase [Opitutaceae bacterium]
MAMLGAFESPDPGQAGKETVAKPHIPDFELVRIAGRGSYGDVWLARSVTGLWRAIKVVWRDRFTHDEPFEREFRGLKEFAEISLGESSQMTLLHVGRNDVAGFFYYVMELADDAERGRHIDPERYVPLTFAELRTRRGRIPADECARYGVEVARVLASLHRRGLVHRDVKPSNIILVSGVPKLADVGLLAPMTEARTFVGTEGYVPPEGPGAPSADVYALGKVLYELSTGHDRQEFPRLPADLRRFPDRAALLELNEIILRACGPTPAQRYREGEAVLRDLTALIAGVSLRTRRLVSSLLRLTAAAGVVVAIGLGGWYWKMEYALPPPPVRAGVSPYSVAVLPFANASGDPAQEFYSDGISDEILHALARERGLRVTGSRSSFSFKGQSRSSVDMAKALRVAHLVEGSVQRVGSRIRLQARLTRAGDGVSVGLGTFEWDQAEVFALLDEVARTVAGKILNQVTMPALVASTRNAPAYAEFLRGRSLQVRYSERSAQAPQVLRQVEQHFKRAVELDPNFAVAWARLAEVRHRIEGIQTARGTSPESALPTVERALALQPNLALAWCVRGFIVGVGQAESAAGLRDLMHAEDLEGPTAETRMTRFLVTWSAGESRGILPLAREAIASNPEAIERISVVPLALTYLGDYAEADRFYQEIGSYTARVYLRRNWRGAEAALRFAARAAPNPIESIELRARLLASLGRVEEARALLESSTAEHSWEAYAGAGMVDRARILAEAALVSSHKSLEALSDNLRTEGERNRKDSYLGQIIAAEIMLGQRESARARLEAWRRDTAQRAPNRRSGVPAVTSMPRYYAQLGETEVTLALLTQSLADGRSLGYELRDTIQYAALRDDPRFLALRRQAEAWAAMQPDPADEPAAPTPPP